MARSEHPTVTTSSERHEPPPRAHETLAGERVAGMGGQETRVTPAGNGSSNGSSAPAEPAGWIRAARDVLAQGFGLDPRMTEEDREELAELAEDLEDAIAYREEVAAAAILTEVEDFIRRVVARPGRAAS
jgi:hypothetical protein